MTTLKGREAILDWYNANLCVGPALAALSESGRRGAKIVIRSPVQLPMHPKRLQGVLRNYHGCCVQVHQTFVGMRDMVDTREHEGDTPDDAIEVRSVPQFKITLEYSW